MSSAALRRARWVSLYLLPLLTCSLSGNAQEDVAPSGPAYTLHAYANLIQMPTLVLGADRRPLPPISREQFTLRFDSGPPFHPAQIHREGDDPITLAILIDDSDPPEESFHDLDTVFASLAPSSLTPRDHIVVFAADCAVFRSLGVVEADPESLRLAVENPLGVAALHGPEKRKGACHNELHLWDTIGFAARELASQPGRRVVLALTNASDHDSTISRRDLEKFANTHSISIFAVQKGPFQVLPTRVHTPSEAQLAQLCEATGGLVLTASSESLPSSLRQFVDLLRGRYIIEFHRPSNATPGAHVLDIKVPTRDAFIRSAGTRAALPDEAITNDPNTVPSDSSQAPLQGDRKTSPKPR